MVRSNFRVFGGLPLGHVAAAEIVSRPQFKVAALIDVAGMKAAVVTQRAEVRDQIDIDALLTMAQISLPRMLAAATRIYGAEFNPPPLARGNRLPRRPRGGGALARGAARSRQCRHGNKARCDSRAPVRQKIWRSAMKPLAPNPDLL